MWIITKGALVGDSEQIGITVNHLKEVNLVFRTGEAYPFIIRQILEKLDRPYNVGYPLEEE